MDKMKMESVDMTAQNIDKIGALFPNCITEAIDENGRSKKVINFDRLKQILSSDILEGDESFELSWVGKKNAIVDSNRPTRMTLRPCKDLSVDWDTTGNIYIEGDNFDTLKVLQESYLHKIKLIYIDPPYRNLYAKKDVIEGDIGFELDWRELPEKKSSKILVEKDVDLTNESDWPTQFDWIMNAMVKMKKAFKKQL